MNNQSQTSHRGLRIAVTGLAATYPFGGVFWDYLQYPLGFAKLGHEVLFIEDTGQWCYDPKAQTFVDDGTHNAAILEKAITENAPALKEHWYFRDAKGQTFGKTQDQVRDFCRTADLFLNISATCWMREDYFAAKRVAFLDSDPMYTQSSIPDYAANTADEATRSRIDLIRRHHVFFSFGENVGQPDCRIPTQVFHWHPTRQPVVIDCFSPHQVPPQHRRKALTTVASWEPAQKGPVVNGVAYWGKSVEFEKFLSFPTQLRQHLSKTNLSMPQLELAMSGRAPKEKLTTQGWSMIDPASVSGDPQTYRHYLSQSLAEWSVAKNAYVAANTGWFSCRTACYLALGVPAIVQDTGFSRFLPTGQGILAFKNMEEALAAVESVLKNPQAHAAAAVEIAREHFDSNRVLGRLLETAMNSR